jgi:hypothetical protein
MHKTSTKQNQISSPKKLKIPAHIKHQAPLGAIKNILAFSRAYQPLMKDGKVIIGQMMN